MATKMGVTLGTPYEGMWTTLGVGMTQPQLTKLPQQLKLDAPPKCLRQRRPGVRALFIQVVKYMRLSKFPIDDWLVTATLHVYGTANLIIIGIEKKR